MKVLLIGNYAADRQYSMQGFTSALEAGLAERGVETRLLAPPSRAGRLPVPHPGVRKWLGYVDKYALFPRDLRRALGWADVVHVCDQGNARYVEYLGGKPHLLTCHDVLAIRSARGELRDWATGWSGRIYQGLILHGLERAGYVACVSEATRRELQQITGLPDDQVTLIENGLYRPYVPMSAGESAPRMRRLGLEPDVPFLLHVGGNQPYKNRLGMLQIFRALQAFPDAPRRLVLAGKPWNAAMRAYVAEQGLADRVFEKTGLDDDDVRALYSTARAFVFPSLYEGFGLPLIEAQSCGCPVFASDRSPLTEVAGDGAVFFDPSNPDEAARIVAEGLASAGLLRERGFENVKRFTTDTMVDKYVRAYRHVLGAVPAGAAL